MKALLPLWICLLAIAGCRDREEMAVYITEIPYSELEIRLEGPDNNGHWRYKIVEEGDLLAKRVLGPLNYDPSSAEAAVDILEDGSTKIIWGDGYAILDITRRMILEDSNEANPKRVGF